MRVLLAILVCLGALTACSDNLDVQVHLGKPGVEGACAGVSNANCLEFSGADLSGVFRGQTISAVCVSGTAALLASPNPSATPGTSGGGSLAAAFGLQPGSSVVGAIIQPTNSDSAYVLSATELPGQDPVGVLLKLPRAELPAFEAVSAGAKPPAGAPPFNFSDLSVVGQSASGITADGTHGATFINVRFTNIAGAKRPAAGTSPAPSPSSSPSPSVSAITLSGYITCKGAFTG